MANPVDNLVSLVESVNRRSVLGADLHLKKICVQIRIGVERRVLGIALRLDEKIVECA